MATAFKHLLWDGYYSTDGICNQRRDPDDDITRCQLHMRRLGFYRGPIDGAMNDQFHDAIRHKKYYPNKPLMPGDSFDYETGPDLGQTQTVTFRGDPNARIANDDVLDANLIAELDNLLPVPPTVAAVDDDFGRIYGASRLQFHDIRLSGTVDVDDLAVRIMSVPMTFSVGEQFAKIRVKLSRYEDIQSMLFRIYRNWDDEDPIPADKIVYQEVLFRDDIRALMDAPDGGGDTGDHEAEAVNFIKTKHWQKGPSFLMKQHASYKCRCWVTTHPNAFDDYADRSKLDRWGQPQAEDYEFHRAMMDVRLVLAERDNNPDPVTGDEIVHDQSDQGGDAWTTGDQAGVNLIEEPCARHDAVYERNAASRYFLDPKPPGFVEEFLADPVGTYLDLWRQRKRDEQFPALYLKETIDELARHVRRIRQSLCCGQDRLTPDAKKLDIEAAIDAAENQALALWGRRLPYRDTVSFFASFAAVAEWIIHHTRTIPEMEFYQLRGVGADGLAYALLRCQFPLSHERNISVTNPDEPSSYLSELVDASERYTCLQLLDAEHCDAPRPLVGNRSDRLRRAIEEDNIVLVPSYSPLDEAFFTLTRQVPVFMLGLIDLPYLNADAHRYTPWQFFNHDMFHTISNANPGGDPYTDTAQMWHWMRNHLVESALSGPPGEGRTIREFTHINAGRREGDNLVYVPDHLARDGFPNLERRERICRTWHANAHLLRDGRNARAQAPEAADFESAYDIVLFCLLHEPVRSQVNLTRCFFPAVPDPDDLWRRMRERGILGEIQARARSHWFGPPSEITPAVIRLMPAAIGMIEEILPLLTPTRAVVNNTNTVTTK